MFRKNDQVLVSKKTVNCLHIFSMEKAKNLDVQSLTPNSDLVLSLYP